MHARRPEAWKSLSETEVALLDFLRKGDKTSELSSERTVQKTLALLATNRRLERLLKVANSEPPRVRALLGALAEELGGESGARTHLRASLNPLSRFEFGQFASLKHARKWQATRLHLHGEVAGGQRAGWPQTIANLNVVEVREDLIVEQVQAVADAQVALAKSKGVLSGRRIAGDGELGTAGLLATKEVAHRLNGGVLSWD